jgi:hypothetical protein
MIKLGNLLKEIEVGMGGGNPRVYMGEPEGTLFKVINFPAISNPNGIPYKEEKDVKFWEIIDKIQDNSSFMVYNIELKGDFSSPNSKVYIYVDQDNYLIYDSLKKIGGNYQTEEAWGIENWKEI